MAVGHLDLADPPPGFCDDPFPGRAALQARHPVQGPGDRACKAVRGLRNISNPIHAMAANRRSAATVRSRIDTGTDELL